MLDPAAWSRSRWLAMLAVVAAATRAPVFLSPFLNGDEATYAALANAMLDGHWLYVGAVDHKPPLIAATYAAVLGVCGRYSLHAVHILSIAVVVATGCLLGVFAGRFLTTRGSGRAAAALFVISSAVGPGQDVLAANAELFMLLPSCAGMAMLAAPSRPGQCHRLRNVPEVGWGLLSGICLGLGVLYKYQAAATVLPALTLVATRGSYARRTRLAVGFVLGLMAPLAGLVCVYGYLRQFEALRFWGWTFPLRYAGALGPGAMVANACLGTVAWGVPLAALLVLAWSGWRHLDQSTDRNGTAGAARLILGVWVAAAALGVAAGGRFVLHYYLQLLPPLCVLAAVGISRLAADGAARRLAIGGFLVPLVAFWTASAADPYLRRDVARDTVAYRHVASFLRAHAAPADTLFVWGNSSQIYFFARMPMGTRFPFCNYQTGKMWGTPADNEASTETADHVVPASWSMLFDDLDRRAPQWIVDAAAAGLDRWQGHDIGVYPRLSAVVKRDYTPVATIDGAAIYRRRPPSAAGAHAAQSTSKIRITHFEDEPSFE